MFFLKEVPYIKKLNSEDCKDISEAKWPKLKSVSLSNWVLKQIIHLLIPNAYFTSQSQDGNQ